MYIAPNTSLKIIKECPLNSDYQDTIFFNDINDQFNYFINLVKFNLNNYSYQRMNSGKIRVEIPVEQLYDCNYLMFKNDSFLDKWFYAFIENVEYVNNNTAEITYTIDVMQTWHFDYELLPAFIEREHSATDIIGENTIPENLEIGPYITTNEFNYILKDYRIGIMRSENVDDLLGVPHMLGGVPVTCYYTYVEFTQAGLETVKSILDTYALAGKSESIICIFIFSYDAGYDTGVFTDTFAGAERKLSKTPRNKKLYTYPYCVHTAIADGNAIEFRYEDFTNGTPLYVLRSTFGANQKILIIPQRYSGYDEDISHALTISGFPLLPYTANYYQNWFAQNQVGILFDSITALGSIAAGVVGIGTPAGVPMIGVGVYKMANILARESYHSSLPDRFSGTANAPDVAAYAKIKGLYTYCRSIKPEYIDIIDDFFDMFGYATHIVKIPNRNVRPHWTYTKTMNCALKGNLPEEHINKIRQIYNNGIRFWKNGNEIGDYSLDNKV